MVNFSIWPRVFKWIGCLRLCVLWVSGGGSVQHGAHDAVVTLTWSGPFGGRPSLVSLGEVESPVDPRVV